MLEIPTPRWTLIQAVKAGLPPPDIVPLTGQERAWSSPIWYTPSAEARKSAPAGMTVTELKKKGATALNDAQLKALIVGKAFWLRNNVTGEQFSQNFTAEGQTIIFRVGNERHHAERASATSCATATRARPRPTRSKAASSSSRWRRSRMRSRSTSSATRTYAARSNEFGYANYEIVPAPQSRSNPLTDLSNQFSIELKLTEEQKKQIVPLLQQEIKQLGELKKDTKLSGRAEGGGVAQAGVSFDEKISPLLNPDQQQKFQAHARAAARIG